MSGNLFQNLFGQPKDGSSPDEAAAPNADAAAAPAPVLPDLAALPEPARTAEPAPFTPAFIEDADDVFASPLASARRAPEALAPAAPPQPASAGLAVGAPVAAGTRLPPALWPADKPMGARVYELCRADGQALLRMPDGAICPAAEGAEGALNESRMLAIIPEANRQICILVSADLGMLHAAGDAGSTPLLSCFVLRTGRDHVYAMRRPLTGSFFGLHSEKDGVIQLAGYITAADETVLFQFRPAARAAVPRPIAQLASEVGTAASQPLEPLALLGVLDQGLIRPSLFGPLVRLLPEDALARLARQIGSDPGTEALITRVLASDPWASEVLPQLCAWRRTRQEIEGNILVSPAQDEDACLPATDTTRMSTGQMLVAALRAETVPRRHVCLLGSARDEGIYLLDWIAYHRSIGFEKIFLYSNENSDGSDRLLAALAAAGEIVWVDNVPGEREGPQNKAYGHALMRLPQILDYRWTAILDIDEFIGFDTGKFRNISEFIAYHETQETHAIALCWVLFGASWDQRAQRGPVFHRFRSRAAGANIHTKPILRTAYFWGAHVHHPYAAFARPFIYRSEGGGLHHHPGSDRFPGFSGAPTADNAWINHYMIRTLPEALMRVTRGRGTRATNQALTRREEYNDVAKRFAFMEAQGRAVADSRLLSCAAEFAATRERLMALPGVAEAQSEIHNRQPGRWKRAVRRLLRTRAKPDDGPELAALRDAARKYHSDEALAALRATRLAAGNDAPPDDDLDDEPEDELDEEGLE